MPAWLCLFLVLNTTAFTIIMVHTDDDNTGLENVGSSAVAVSGIIGPIHSNWMRQGSAGHLAGSHDNMEDPVSAKTPFFS
ncbi:hypothetical protein P3T73_07255 [Kiritimatiellota bacterium B12222]|nr:hypothetical protein P3T73_07255 [Kiritimatiellota bacterium B12222]